MLCHKSHFMIRHRDAPDVPFQLYNKETLEPDRESLAYSSENDLLKWTPNDSNFPENSADGNRWMRASPMYSDGELIYFLVQYKRSSYTSETIKTVLETYEVDETTRRMTRVNELTLYKDE